MELRPVQQSQRFRQASRVIRHVLLSPNRSVWDNDAGATYPALTGDVQADACVVGLGGSGLAAVDEFQRAGISVVGVDAGPVGGAAAGRNGGLLRAGTSLFYHEAASRYGIDRAARMYSETAVERERILSRFPAAARRCGHVRLASDAEEERDCRSHLAAMHKAGFPASWYEGPLGVGVLVAADAAIDPLQRCRLEAAAAAAAGARIFENSEVLRLTTGRVETAAGAVRCRVVVVAVDGALANVLPELEGRVWPMRLQMLASGPHAAATLPHAIGTRSGWDYAQQLPDGVIAFGGCRDVGGDAERTMDSTPTESVQGALDRRLRDVTGVTPDVTHRWAATAGYTATGLPVLEQVRPGIWATGGYCGTGNLLGAACGRHAARLASGIRGNSLLE